MKLDSAFSAARHGRRFGAWAGGAASPVAWLAVPALGFMALVYAVPLLALLTRSVSDPEPGLENYRRILQHAGYLRTIGRTLGLAALSTVFALLLGYPIAYVMAMRAGTRLARFLTFCIVAPYVTSLLVRTFSWQVLLGRVGPFNQLLHAVGLARFELLFTPAAVLIGLTHFLLPMMILPLVSVMRGIDPTLRRAAASLGAGPAVTFVRVFVPASVPGIRTGTALCFIYGVGAFVIPALLGGNSGRMLGALVQTAISQQADYGLAAAASVILASLVCAVGFVLRRGLSGRQAVAVEVPARDRTQGLARDATAARPGWFASTLVKVLSGPAAWLDRAGLSSLPGSVSGFAAVMGLAVVLPQAVTLPLSFSSSRTLVFPPPGWSLQWYASFATPDWTGPLLTSVTVGLAVTALAVLLGSLAAFGVTRGLSGRTGAIARLLLLLPLLFPTIVAATAFFIAFLPLHLDDTWIGLVAAHTTLAVPFVFLIVSGHLSALNPTYERAASSLGAGNGAILRRIVLPLLKRSVLTGAFFAFTTSFDEAAISIMLSGLNVKTLPRRMYEALAWESDPTVAVVAIVAMAVTAAATLLSGRWSSGRQRPPADVRPETSTPRTEP
ncbi:ABC transporter permease subunit [Chitinasiproducens palmae]|nr:ABC transporter permease subunit [Chitinasiproducens palmae]